MGAAQGPAALMRISQGMVVVVLVEEEEEMLLTEETTTLSAHADLWLMPVTSPLKNFTPKSPALFLKAKSSCQGSNQPSFLTPKAPQLMSSTLSHGNLRRSSAGDLDKPSEKRNGAAVEGR